MTLNLLMPGSGQFYFGQPVMGSVYAIGFLACFVDDAGEVHGRVL